MNYAEILAFYLKYEYFPKALTNGKKRRGGGTELEVLTQPGVGVLVMERRLPQLNVNVLSLNRFLRVF